MAFLVTAVFPFILCIPIPSLSFFFFFNDTATTEIYTLSLHDALPISETSCSVKIFWLDLMVTTDLPFDLGSLRVCRSEEHTSELQSQSNLVCRLLLEKKNNIILRCRYDTCIRLTLRP